MQQSLRAQAVYVCLSYAMFGAHVFFKRMERRVGTWHYRVLEPLNLTEKEIDALVAFVEALVGEGHQDTAPAAFP